MGKIPLWLKIIGFMILPIILFPVFNHITYPLKPHCSIGRGPYGCTPMCEPRAYFDNGNPSEYRVTPCYHVGPTLLQKTFYEEPERIIGALVVAVIALSFWLTNSKKWILLPKIAFAPIYFLKENRSKKFLPRIFNFLLIIPLTIEWASGYVIVIGTLLNKINLF